MTLTQEHIIQIVEQIVAKRGTSADAAIPILQDIQQEFNYLPDEALKHVCEITEIITCPHHRNFNFLYSVPAPAGR